MGRNLVKFEKIDDVISNFKYDVIIVILMSQQLREWKVTVIVSLFLDGPS